MIEENIIMSQFTRGQVAEIDAGIIPKAAHKTVTFDGGITSGKLSTKAAATTSLTGTNNDMVFTADTAGTAGNLISIEYRDTVFPLGNGAAKVHLEDKAIIVDLKTSAGVRASTVLTTNNTNVTDGKVVVVNDITYRFKNTPAQLYDVKKGASADATLLSLAKTINGTGAAGTDMFAGTPAHTSVSSSAAVASHKITLTALAVGTAGNAYPSTTDETTLSFTSTVFAGGENVNQILSLASEIKTAIEANTAAAALVDIANSGTDDGSGVVTTLARTYLTGGSDGKVPLFTVTGEILCSLRGYCATNLAGTNATLVHGVTGTTNMLIPILTSTNIVANKGIDKSAAVVARGTALDATPVWRVADESIFATTATAATTAGKIHYILDFIDISQDGNSTVVAA
jgi:hypothetical protein